MKLLYFLLFVTVCKGNRECTSPKNVRVITNGDSEKSWFDVSWSKDEDIELDPIVGYKVKMWVVKPKITDKYETNPNGEVVNKPVFSELPKLNVDDEPSDELTELDIPANKTEATIHGLETGVTYEIGVHCYTAKNQGKLTKKMRIKLDKNN